MSRLALAALRQAEVDGLTLMRSESSNSGYKGVTFSSGRPMKPYQAKVQRGGKNVSLGTFATAEEAALAYARSPEGRAAVAAAAAPPAPPPPPMTAEEALRQAEAEGLTLLLSDGNNSGYKGVTFNSGQWQSKPYQAKVRRSGKQVALGTFSTVEEAALVYARSPEAQAVVAAAAALPAPPPSMTAEEALRQAEAEGLTLLRTESSNTGYKGVSFTSGRPTPYQAQVKRGGKTVTLGSFATAEEAALSYARSPEAQAVVAAAAAMAAAPPAPLPMTAEEALRQAEAEGLTLVRSESSSTGYKGVTFKSRPKTKPYKAQVWRCGKKVNFGYYATAEEAALVFARDSAAQAAPPQPSAATRRKRKVKSEEQPPDMPAGARVKLEEEPPPMPNDARVKLESESRFES